MKTRKFRFLSAGHFKIKWNTQKFYVKLSGSYLILRIILLRVCCELLYETDFSECSNVLLLSLKEQRILVLLWAQYCKILAGALTRQITKRLLLVLIFTKRLVVWRCLHSWLSWKKFLICVYLGGQAVPIHRRCTL